MFVAQAESTLASDVWTFDLIEENAVNLAYGFLGLQDNYDLDGFEEKRQAALTALVACCPQKAAQ